MSADRQKYDWVVPADEARTRLDRFIARRGVLGTRSQVQRLISEGSVLVDDRAAKAATLIRAGQRVSVDRPINPTIAFEPQAIAIDVLYEDPSILVIDKPAGLVVHPAPGHWSGTLVNALLHRWREKRQELDLARLGIVHRLDKDTSGVLIVAKDPASLAELGEQFRRRMIHKRYLALVYGVPRRTSGIITEPIGRHPVERKRMSTRAGGRQAVTRYEVLEQLPGSALVRVYPETGRTHQIRVHLAAIGHPVVADPTYARGRRREAFAISRQALHAESIRFCHPSSGEPMEVAAPLAADLAQMLGQLRNPSLTSRGGSSSVRADSTTPQADRSGAFLTSTRSNSSCKD